MNLFGPTLLGDKIAIQANCHTLLFNKHGDTIPNHFDSLPGVVWNEKVHTVKTKIPVHHLNEGLYFVSLNHQDYTFPVQKLLINP